MSGIILTRGLPASGKSTWSKNWVLEDPKRRVRVNRDDIRLALYGTYYGPEIDENRITRAEEFLVADAVREGKDVVIDAMHLKAAYAKKWAKLYPHVWFQDFPVNLSTLVERDFGRGSKVGEGVIRKLAKRFHIPESGKLPAAPDLKSEHLGNMVFRPYVPGGHKTYSFDIDGTLALMTGRSPYDPSRYDEDIPNHPIVQILWDLQDWAAQTEVPTFFIGLSGRSADYAEVTLEWLSGWGIELDYLFMRPSGDTRNDAIVKSELVDKHITGKFDVIAHFDDRDRVVNALRTKGMTVLQVAPGDF